MVDARIVLDDYANRVINVIKAKFGLKDKSEAINKFITLYGDEVIEKEASEKYVQKVIIMSQEHLHKYGRRKMSLKELNQLCGLN